MLPIRLPHLSPRGSEIEVDRTGPYFGVIAPRGPSCKEEVAEVDERAGDATAGKRGVLQCDAVGQVHLFLQQCAGPDFGKSPDLDTFQERGALVEAGTDFDVPADLAPIDLGMSRSPDHGSFGNAQRWPRKRRMTNHGTWLDGVKVDVFADIDPLRAPIPPLPAP